MFEIRGEDVYYKDVRVALLDVETAWPSMMEEFSCLLAGKTEEEHDDIIRHEGYEQGFDQGKKEGYDEGYDAGYDQSEKNMGR
ncbi:MAG: hypothetical protein HOI21_14540 [Bacteroidetes Order II. Incertae sedis bacterium]|jgi:flagellar biosynthesis/type III secretory pathway protein FliH|nr:hypothetical protein [Bacteroidetes Order II. bacterium]